jgi:large subunit ribosomal protein L6
MSRIGKLPIEIPAGVTAVIESNKIKVTGPKGELNYEFSPLLKAVIEDNKIMVTKREETRDADALSGLTRTLISNMVVGVSEGFVKKLEFVGVGYRAAMEGKDLVMHLGFSHPVRYIPREGVEIKVEKNTITVTGIDKQLVGQTAAEIREKKKPEPYKGKGIKYEGERIRRKAGKAAAKAAS